MLFNSAVFLFCFLPLTLAAYYAIGRTGNHQLPVVILVVASLFFYGWWDPALVLLLISSIVLNFGAGLWIAAARTQATAHTVTIAGIIGNLALLGYYKYAGFAVETINLLDSVGFPVPTIVLPLAISFFTFQQIAYLADVRAEKKAERNLLTYALFVTFFPQLIAGPIVHHKEMIPQYANHPAAQPVLRNLSAGLSIFAIGLFKKIYIADSVAGYATSVFEAASRGSYLSFFEAWCGTLAYTFQIYYDFSAYSEMAVGLGLMFGFRLPINFMSPYKAANIIDFWRCWHMTLSRFLRDYLYIPLGGNRRGRSRRYVNLAITMLLGGLWHGAGWTFVIWGGLHGFYLVVNHFWKWLIKCLFPRRSMGGATGKWIGRVITFFAVAVAWVFFRANSVDTALHVLSSMAGLNGIPLPLSLKPHLGNSVELLESFGLTFSGMFSNNVISGPGFALSFLAVLLVYVWTAPNTVSLITALDPGRKWLPEAAHATRWRGIKWRPTLVWGVTTGLLLAACALGLQRVSEFIYFNF